MHQQNPKSWKSRFKIAKMRVRRAKRMLDKASVRAHNKVTIAGEADLSPSMRTRMIRIGGSEIEYNTCTIRIIFGSCSKMTMQMIGITMSPTVSESTGHKGLNVMLFRLSCSRVRPQWMDLRWLPSGTVDLIQMMVGAVSMRPLAKEESAETTISHVQTTIEMLRCLTSQHTWRKTIKRASTRIWWTKQSCKVSSKVHKTKAKKWISKTKKKKFWKKSWKCLRSSTRSKRVKSIFLIWKRINRRRMQSQKTSMTSRWCVSRGWPLQRPWHQFRWNRELESFHLGITLLLLIRWKLAIILPSPSTQVNLTSE